MSRNPDEPDDRRPRLRVAPLGTRTGPPLEALGPKAPETLATTSLFEEEEEADAAASGHVIEDAETGPPMRKRIADLATGVYPPSAAATMLLPLTTSSSHTYALETNGSVTWVTREHDRVIVARLANNGLRVSPHQEQWPSGPPADAWDTFVRLNSEHLGIRVFDEYRPTWA